MFLSGFSLIVQINCPFSITFCIVQNIRVNKVAQGRTNKTVYFLHSSDLTALRSHPHYCATSRRAGVQIIKSVVPSAVQSHNTPVSPSFQTRNRGISPCIVMLSLARPWFDWVLVPPLQVKGGAPWPTRCADEVAEHGRAGLSLGCALQHPRFDVFGVNEHFYDS